MINLLDLIIKTTLPEDLFPLTLHIGTNSPLEGIRLESKVDSVVSQGELLSLIKSDYCTVYLSHSVSDEAKELMSKLIEPETLNAKSPKPNKINLEFRY